MRPSVVASLVVVSMLLAGCATSTEDPDDPDDAPMARHGAVIWHDAAGRPAPPGATPDSRSGPVDFERPVYPYGISVDPTGARGWQGEPSIVVDDEGTIYYQSWESIVRSHDGGRTWTVVHSAPATMDPVLHLDHDTQRLFSSHLYLEAACTHLSWSDDRGDTWLTNPVGCVSAGLDHQRITTGPPVPGLTTEGYPNLVYLAYNANPGVRVAVSRDGGLTFRSEHQALPAEADVCDSGLHGPPITTSTGALFIPKSDCSGFLLLTSTDGARTWTSRSVGTAAGGGACRPDPVLARSADDDLYGAWLGDDDGVYYAWSDDGGTTWSPALRLTPPTINTTTFPTAVAAGDGLAVAYYGTTAVGKGADGVSEDAIWDLYVTLIAEPKSDNPKMVTMRLTQDPLQVGPLWTHWECDAPPDARNHLDFIGSAVDAGGRVFIAYTDGCVDACAATPSMGSSRSSEPAIAWVDPYPGRT